MHSQLINPKDPDSERWRWERDKETVNKAQGLLATLQKAEFIMDLLL